MEVTAPIQVTKKQNTSYRVNNLNLIEHVREFRLPQQFPSTTKQANIVAEKNKNVKVTLHTPTSLNTFNVKKLLPSTDCMVPCKKLRIMSPKGKDLGEFNIELRSNPSKGQILTITKSDTLKLNNKPIISLFPIAYTPKKTIPRILRQEPVKMGTNEMVKMTDDNYIFKNNENTCLKLRPIIVPAKKIFRIRRDAEIDKKIEFFSNDISVDKISICTNEKDHKQPVNNNLSNDDHVYIKHKPVILIKNNKYSINNVNTLSKEESIEPEVLKRDIKAFSVAKDVSYKEIAESPYPIVSCVKLAINSANNNNNNKVQMHKINEKKFVAIAKNTENKERVTIDSISNSIQDYNQIQRDSNQHVSMEMIEKNNDSLLNITKQYISKPEEVADICTNIQSDKQNENYPDNSQKDLSDQWDIIRKAMNSVKDDELRIQALKALANCGIGIEKHVPLCPTEFKSVHDTQVQTTVFGLLDPTSFVLINKDLDSIQRLQQITLRDISSVQSPLENNLYPYNSDSIFNTSDMIEQESDFDIEKFINEMCRENSDVLKVKETLSTTNSKCRKIIEQLQRDFETVKKYDENGMLNIHNAVIRNNTFDVQRHLIILRQFKESVDILTENETTSLELAIKYDVCSKIVEILLQAGAQPIKMKPTHESALIIASKQSSALLPLLVNYVSNPKLLDQVDSEGFAALHYCCMHGNAKGVNTLLSAGANVNVKDMKSGRTPLFHALNNNYTSIAQDLLLAGAVANIPNFAGQTALSITYDLNI